VAGVKLNNAKTVFRTALLTFVAIGLSITLKSQPTKIMFWDNQQKGANYFNAVPIREWFESAASANIKFVRLTYEKWKGAERDFLIGNADEYKGIVESDFQKLVSILNIADSLNIKIVITPISLPGTRWVQNNNGVRDGRLWKEEKYHKQTCQFWKDLAQKLKNHPAIVGYNIQNEPHPGKTICPNGTKPSKELRQI
jgi:endoglucanase